MRAEFGRIRPDQAFNRIWADVGQIWARVGQNWPSSGKFRRNPTNIGLNVTSDLGRVRQKWGRCRTGSGPPTSALAAKHRAGKVEQWDIVQARPFSGENPLKKLRTDPQNLQSIDTPQTHPKQTIESR